MPSPFPADDVTIREVPSMRVAIMERHGDPADLGATIRRLIALRKAARSHPRAHPIFNVWRSERCPASAADVRVDICVGTDQPVAANGERITVGEIPGGRCAVLRVVGRTDNPEPPALYPYRMWLRRAARTHAISPSTASASRSSGRCRSTRPSRSCSCR